MPTSRDTDAISWTFASYIEAFQTLDANAVAAYCHVPCMLVAPQGVQVMPSAAEVSAMFGRMMAGLKARGYARSRLTDLHVEPMSEAAAVVSVSRTRQGADGQDLELVGGASRGTFNTPRSDPATLGSWRWSRVLGALTPRVRIMRPGGKRRPAGPSA